MDNLNNSYSSGISMSLSTAVPSSSCTALLDDAISCMSYTDKEAFLEVMERNPAVVINETDPSYVLQFEQYNIWDAAQRITNYWRWKKRIFGPERYVRDLFDLSGRGALDTDDITLLHTGYVANTPLMNDGTSVLVFDRSQLGDTDWELVDANRNYRTGFYGIAIAAREQQQRQQQLLHHQQQQQQQIQPPGPPSFILINLIHTMPKFKQNAKDFADLIYQTSPVRLKNNHTIFITQSDYTAFFLRMVIPAVDRNLRRIFPTLTLTLFTSITDALTKLQQLGFRSDALPSSLGGTWQYNTITIATRISASINTNNISRAATLATCTSATSMDQSLLQQLQHSNSSQTLLHPHNQLLFSSSSSSLMQDDVVANQQQMQHHQQAITNQQKPQSQSIDDSLLYNFLQYNRNDNEQVRKHIQIYTVLRQGLFPNRSNLPITQTGFGALTAEDIALLNTGFIMVLPNDLSGNSVIALELCKVESSNLDSIRRCYFYILSVLTEQRMSDQQRKIVLLAFMNDITSDRLRDSLVLTDITQAFPIELSFTHIFIHPFGLGWLTFQSKAEALLLTVLNVPEKQRSVHILDADYRYDESFVVTFNIKQEHLPIQLGGNWSYENSFRLWQQHRITVENNNNNRLSASAAVAAEPPPPTTTTRTTATTAASYDSGGEKEDVDETVLDPIRSNDSAVVGNNRVEGTREVSTKSRKRSTELSSPVTADGVTSTDIVPDLVHEITTRVNHNDDTNNNNNNNNIIIVDDTTIPILDEPSECFSINTQLFDEDGNHHTDNNDSISNDNNHEHNGANNDHNDTTIAMPFENCIVGFYVNVPNVVRSS